MLSWREERFDELLEEGLAGRGTRAGCAKSSYLCVRKYIDRYDQRPILAP